MGATVASGAPLFFVELICGVKPQGVNCQAMEGQKISRLIFWGVK